MKNSLTDLYDTLFETMRTLSESSATAMELNIKKANAIRQVAQTVIDAGKLEVAVRRMKDKGAPQDGLFTEPKQLETGEKKE